MNQGKVVGIVQARMGSTRFPSKMQATLGKFSLLEWVLRRISLSKKLDQIVLATSDKSQDDVLDELAVGLGLDVFRGSEVDVLSRFIGAAEYANAKSIVRICADNPFIDPAEVDRLIEYFELEKCDYACNHQDRQGSSYADGFGAEIFSVESLKKIISIGAGPVHREHVTLGFWENNHIFKLKSIMAPKELAYPKMRFDIDTEFDLKKLNFLVSNGVGINTPASEIIKVAIKLECNDK